MVQNNIEVNDGTGLEVRTGFNDAVKTIATNFSDDTAPDPSYPNQFWLDLSQTNPRLWIRDKDDSEWILIGTLKKNQDGTYIFKIANIIEALGYTPANAAITINGHTLTDNIVISATDLSAGILAVKNGGTGAIDAPDALVNLGAVPIAGGNMQGKLGLKAYTETIVNKGNIAGSTGIDWSTGNIHQITLIGSTILSFSNATAGQSITIILTQDGTGSRLVTWPTVKWVGTAPTLSTGANRTDILVVLFDGSNYYGFLGGIGF